MQRAKKEALALYLEVNKEELDESKYDSDIFIHGNAEYLVLTGKEMDQRTEEYIMDSLWAFNSDFIGSHSNLNAPALKALSKMQAELCEDANELVKAVIRDIDHFVKDAVLSDGRGHFLSGYDGEENEIEHKKVMFYIYRTN